MMSQPWQPAYWAGTVHKHRPVGNKIPWDRVRFGTNQGQRISKYHSSLTLEEIRNLEMSFIEPDDLVIERKTVRYFIARSDRQCVGASRGQDTRYVIINRSQTGAVHGYPATVEEILELLEMASDARRAELKRKLEL
jgi:hypothetical protein